MSMTGVDLLCLVVLLLLDFILFGWLVHIHTLGSLLSHFVLFWLPRLDVTESGLAAIVRLSNGDMRKALNILQVCLLL